MSIRQDRNIVETLVGDRLEATMRMGRESADIVCRLIRAEFILPVPEQLNALIYVYEGAIAVGSSEQPGVLQSRQLGRLDAGNEVRVRAMESDGRT